MATAYNNNTAWKENENLENKLRSYVLKQMQINEILDYVSSDYHTYPWSLRTLDRRLRYFNIYYINKNLPLDEARNEVKNELNFSVTGQCI